MSINLLATTSRVATPFISVQIGEYKFGVFSKEYANTTIGNELIKVQKITYPNYIQSLKIKKINGTVNTYTLVLKYPITSQDDPNFFEKVFSSVSSTRSIIFSYGDLSLPTYCYRDEEAIITKVSSSFDISTSVITYTITAVSTGSLVASGSYSFPARNCKPSDVIKEILFNKSYGLQEIFTGMYNRTYVEQYLIPSDDKKVSIEAKVNISILDYLSYLVNCMSPLDTSSSSLTKGSVYVMLIIDDTTGNENLQGTYFKIVRTNNQVEYADAYEIDIGYPNENVITSFSVDDDETYAIYYDYQEELNDNSYVQRVDDSGNIYSVYSPVIASGTSSRTTTEAEKSWWTKTTQYPIKVEIKMKGLIRPAILMSYVKLNVLFYGKKHIHSGIYLITKQVDEVSTSGFFTTLDMVRVDSVDYNV